MRVLKETLEHKETLELRVIVVHLVHRELQDQRRYQAMPTTG